MRVKVKSVHITYLLTYLFIHLLIHLLTYSLTHSMVQYIIWKADNHSAF
jgi:hypothetical protein